MRDELTEQFLGQGSASTPKRKTTFVCNEDDYLLLRAVFPESGFTTYLPGLIIKKLADECRKRNITTVSDRYGTSLESVIRVLSSFEFVGDQDK
jgi:hypothetical protein